MAKAETFARIKDTKIIFLITISLKIKRFIKNKTFRPLKDTKIIFFLILLVSFHFSFNLEVA